MNTQPFFSLVFVNYQSAGHLRAALVSLYTEERDESLYEVIVVNNDVRERALVKALGEEFPSLRFRESPENRGFGAGVNLGAAVGSGTVLGFLNPDLVWKKPILAELRSFFLTDTKLGVAGLGLLAETSVPEAWSNGSEPSLLQILKNNLFSQRGLAEKSFEKTPFQRDWVSGGALFVSRELFSKLGGFDEQFFLYFEDVDFCRRVRGLGFQVMVFSALAIYHKGGQSHSSRKEQKDHYYRSQNLYFRKHFSFLSYLLLRIFRSIRYGR